MALNWYMTLRQLAKTNPQAVELLEQLKNAGTEDEKATAKQRAMEFVTQSNSMEESVAENTTTETTEETTVAENQKVVSDSDSESDNVVPSTPDSENGKSDKEEQVKTDLSQLAFTPRLAKFGITREEELFLKGVFVRKMTREEKILMRRSIYQKKTLGNAKIQAEFKAKRLEQRQKDMNDPEKQKFHQERKYVSAIVNALEQHRNLGWIFSNIDGLTIDIFKELIKKPGNVNAFRQMNPKFIENFTKKYGV